MSEIELKLSELNTLVKELREQTGLTREAFGQIAGESPQNIYSIETDRVKLGLNRLKKIISPFGYTVKVYLSDKRKKNK